MNAIETYLNNVVKDLAGQNDKVPVSKFRVEVTESTFINEGKLFAPDWFKYGFITGRGPGKLPPEEPILSWIKRVGINPKLTLIQLSLQNQGKAIDQEAEYQSLAWAIRKKIGRDGTDIWMGKKKGIDFLGAIDRNKPELLQKLAEENRLNIETSLQNALKKK